jgi:hypothetical protein
MEFSVDRLKYLFVLFGLELKVEGVDWDVDLPYERPKDYCAMMEIEGGSFMIIPVMHLEARDEEDIQWVLRQRHRLGHTREIGRFTDLYVPVAYIAGWFARCPNG